MKSECMKDIVNATFEGRHKSFKMPHSTCRSTEQRLEAEELGGCQRVTKVCEAGAG